MRLQIMKSTKRNFQISISEILTSKLGVNLSGIEKILQNEIAKFKNEEIHIERQVKDKFVIHENNSLEEGLHRTKSLSKLYAYTFLLQEQQTFYQSQAKDNEINKFFEEELNRKNENFRHAKDFSFLNQKKSFFQEIIDPSTARKSFSSYQS